MRIAAGVCVLALCVATETSGQAGGAAAQQQQPMGFFITSAGPGDGANLGGLAGADAHCQRLAQETGAGARSWRAYLSATAGGGQAPVNARDRIGNGPWHNAKGVLIAWNVADLHGDLQRDRNNINKEFALNEKGLPVNGRGDTPNQHDILTGSDSHGRAMFGGAATTTCNNWTSNAAGNAIVGHHDRAGGGTSSWNAAHPSRGCGQADLVATGGAGLFYCFAAN
ncbi:MAG TPA: hypothetical protein VMM77_06210 [Gemmatimonadaceae bacterium]|nr:hypothetical protein [Gemmatimonadaceae bacterium]